jgi:hypothetical protein
MKSATRYRIKIVADERRGLYSTSGSAAITASANPMLDVAKSLLAHRAEPASTLEGRWEGALVGPAALASITKHRSHPRVDPRRAGLNAVD